MFKPETFDDPAFQWEQLLAQASGLDRPDFEKAFALASQLHDGRYRRSRGTGHIVPYIVHPLRVARVLLEEWAPTDRRSVVAALFHDALSQGGQKAEAEIENLFGREMIDALWTLAKPALPSTEEETTHAARDARYFSALRQAPEWVRIVKCADRLDNLREACRRGDARFWRRFSTHTIGWHLYLARETSAVAEVALFGAIVNGEKHIHGHVPIWLDGHLVDPVAARLVPSSIALENRIVGLALRGDTLVVGTDRPADRCAVSLLESVASKRLEVVRVTTEALQDALASGLYAVTSVPAVAEYA